MQTTNSNYLLLTAAIANAATLKTAQIVVKTVLSQVTKWLSPRVPNPRVYQHFNRSGQVYWSGFDPSTGSFIGWVSEPEIRAWIEQRYR